MAVTGGIKFLYENKIKDGAAVGSTGDASAKYALDLDVDTYWRSVGSSDTTTETLTVTFDTQTIDRVLLLDCNFKGFTVKYLSGASYVHFSNVIGIGGVTKTNITETSFSENSAYYEFDSVSTGGLQISIDTTQTTNAEKYISQFIGSSEIGTFVGYPDLSSIELNRNSRSIKTLSGRYSVQKSLETMGYSIAFKNYPTSAVYNVDIDLAVTLLESESPFIIYPCGGRYESKHFTTAIPGFRLKDAKLVQVVNGYKLKYLSNIYTNPMDLGGLDLVSHV
jgi:hypothetical protein